ncbi:MAG TPA: BlaI/MecI/CopY family transcriptional regulator [Terriglobales bacterium]|nr:BlaI/MecI/CopY family transcriptional regulator [Terriglobales bacterium]
MSNTRTPVLGHLEQEVMEIVWSRNSVTAEDCRIALLAQEPERSLKESTIRTVLRRLEAKGYLAHEVEGRTFIYRAALGRGIVAGRAVKNIIDRFCGGSAEALLVGMVDDRVLDAATLDRLARRIAEAKPERKR